MTTDELFQYNMATVILRFQFPAPVQLYIILILWHMHVSLFCEIVF